MHLVIMRIGVKPVEPIEHIEPGPELTTSFSQFAGKLFEGRNQKRLRSLHAV